MEDTLEHPVIEFLMMADRAESVNGKLYVMGGAWDQIAVADFTQPVSFSLALAVLIPWHATNERLPLTVSFESEDGAAVLPPLRLEVEAGRPANAVKGQSFRNLLAINGLAPFPAPGGYRARATLGDADAKSVQFRVTAAQPPAPGR